MLVSNCENTKKIVGMQKKCLKWINCTSFSNYNELLQQSQVLPLPLYLHLQDLLMLSKRVRDISSPAIWATKWRRSHGRQKCRPNGLIKLINQLIYLKRLAYLLYGSVASLPSSSSNIKAWPYVTSLRFALLLHIGH